MYIVDAASMVQIHMYMYMHVHASTEAVACNDCKEGTRLQLKKTVNLQPYHREGQSLSPEPVVVGVRLEAETRRRKQRNHPLVPKAETDITGKIIYSCQLPLHRATWTLTLCIG